MEKIGIDFRSIEDGSAGYGIFIKFIPLDIFAFGCELEVADYTERRVNTDIDSSVITPDLFDDPHGIFPAAGIVDKQLQLFHSLQRTGELRAGLDDHYIGIGIVTGTDPAGELSLAGQRYGVVFTGGSFYRVIRCFIIFIGGFCCDFAAVQDQIALIELYSAGKITAGCRDAYRTDRVVIDGFDCFSKAVGFYAVSVPAFGGNAAGNMVDLDLFRGGYGIINIDSASSFSCGNTDLANIQTAFGNDQIFLLTVSFYLIENIKSIGIAFFSGNFHIHFRHIADGYAAP